MVVNSEIKAVAYDNLSQEFAPSSSTMTLQQPQQQVTLQEPDPAFPPLNKQNSILSLTLDEIQCKSGKSFGSMSMDEFLASIWSSDDNQVNPLALPTHDEGGMSKSVATEQPNISQQGTFSVPPPICKKTVDEVWSEIHKGQQPQQNEANNHGRNKGTLKRQQTLGEMTLEDFLIKAGVVQESSIPFKPSPQPRIAVPFQNQTVTIASNNNRPLDASYGLRPAMGLGFCTQQNVGNCNGIATYQMLSQNNNSVSVIRDPNTSRAVEKYQSLPESSGSSIRNRIIDGPPEVVVERRQRRMLKNRESAARSRARRQVLWSSYIICSVILQFDLVISHVRLDCVSIICL